MRCSIFELNSYIRYVICELVAVLSIIEVYADMNFDLLSSVPKMYYFQVYPITITMVCFEDISSFILLF